MGALGARRLELQWGRRDNIILFNDQDAKRFKNECRGSTGTETTMLLKRFSIAATCASGSSHPKRLIKLPIAHVIQMPWGIIIFPLLMQALLVTGFENYQFFFLSRNVWNVDEDNFLAWFFLFVWECAFWVNTIIYDN